MVKSDARNCRNETPHVHVGVVDLEESIRFYSTLFGAEPTERESDYAKWMVDESRVNFAISTRSDGAAGLGRLGIRAEDRRELDRIAARAKDAGSDRNGCVVLLRAIEHNGFPWDLPATLWETFYTYGDIMTYGQSAEARRVESKAGAVPVVASCCG